MIMNGYNDNEVVDFIKLTREEPVHVRFIEFMPFPGNHWRPEKLISFKEIIEIVKSEFPNIEKLVKIKLRWMQRN